MSSVSPRTGFLSVVQRAGVSTRRLVRSAGRFVSQLCLATVRAAVTSLVFTTGVMAMLYWLGVPIPGPADVLEKFEALGRLADILS